MEQSRRRRGMTMGSINGYRKPFLYFELHPMGMKRNVTIIGENEAMNKIPTPQSGLVCSARSSLHKLRLRASPSAQDDTLGQNTAMDKIPAPQSGLVCSARSSLHKLRLGLLAILLSDDTVGQTTAMNKIPSLLRNAALSWVGFDYANTALWCLLRSG